MSTKLSIAGVLVGLMFIVILLPACTQVLPSPAPSSPAPAPLSPAAPTPTEVTTIDIGSPTSKNWDADAEVDGIKFDLTPKDAQGKMVMSPGILSAKLWLEKSFLEGGGKGDLAQEWSNIQITKSDYDMFGVTIHLEYRDFTPKEGQYGICEVIFTTPDGRIFENEHSSENPVRCW